MGGLVGIFCSFWGGRKLFVGRLKTYRHLRQRTLRVRMGDLLGGRLEERGGAATGQIHWTGFFKPLMPLE